MKDIELLETVISVLSPKHQDIFRRYLQKHHRIGALRGSVISLSQLAHEARDRPARTAVTLSKKGCAKYAGETPEQVYAKVYNARVEAQLAYLKWLVARH